MKVIILAAGQGSRLRPLTDDRPKCMVEVNGKSIIERQLEVMYACGIKETEITIIAGYRNDVLKEKFRDTDIQLIVNNEYETTNMVYSLMCARKQMESEEDVIISYGDIFFDKNVFNKILSAEHAISVIVDDGWYEYWSERCENPLEDAETLMIDTQDNLIEIGQKTKDIGKVQSQYIGLMRFREEGLAAMTALALEAQERSRKKIPLWRTDRSYQKMYMTDLLQGLIDSGNQLKAEHINRGWYEIDNCDDLKLVESKLGLG